MNKKYTLEMYNISVEQKKSFWVPILKIISLCER